MKQEISIEEKARRYDEAIENMRKFRNALNNQEKIDLWVLKEEIVKDIEYYFPELKESEGEKIRKNLITLFKDEYSTKSNARFAGIKVKDIIAWLEKQGERKQIIIPKFRVGDTIRIKGSYAEYKITDIHDGSYYGKGWSIGIEGEDDYELVEQKPTEWHREDEQNLNACLGYIQDEFLRRWLTDIIHVKYDKLAWSKEDELAYISIINDLKQNVIPDEEDIAWLKSLKDRYAWKPSEEQVKALNYVVNLMALSESPKENDYYYNVFKDLREQLKKLKD